MGFSYKQCLFRFSTDFMSSRLAMKLNDLSVDPDPNLWDLPPRVFISLRDSLDADNTYERLFEVMPDCYSKHLWKRIKIFSYNHKCHSSPADILLKGLGSQGVTASLLAHWLEELSLEKILMLLKKDEPLKIIENPAPEKKLVEGETLHLVCRATSFPSPKYQWFRSDQELLLHQKSELVIPNIRKSDMGIYICRVHKVNSTRGDLSYDFSTQSSVTVIPLSRVSPYTTEDRHHQECSIVSSSSNSISTQGDISSGLIDTNMRRFTNVVHHEKEELIKIIKQPVAPTKVPRSTSLKLSCVAKFRKKYQMEHDIQYQWFCDGREIPGETSPDLYLNNIVEKNGKLEWCYMCRAYYEEHSCLSNPVKLRLKPSDDDMFQAEEKLALLIACDEYENFESLYSSNDVEKLADQLRDMDFNVLAFRNLKLQDMKNAINMYSKMLRPGSYSLVYFGGHGFELHSQLYLKPVDCVSKYDPQECISINYILDCIQRYSPDLNVLLLDACRNIGLNITESDQILVPPNGNTVIGYATSSSQGAYEYHKEKTSCFIKYLLKCLPHEKKVQDVLYSVQCAMKSDQLVGGCQFPYVCSSLNEARTLADPVLNREDSVFDLADSWALEWKSSIKEGSLEIDVILQFCLHKRIYWNGIDVNIYVKICENTDPKILLGMNFDVDFSPKQMNKVMKNMDYEAQKNEATEMFHVKALEIQGIQTTQEKLYGELVITAYEKSIKRPFGLVHPLQLIQSYCT